MIGDGSQDTVVILVHTDEGITGISFELGNFDELKELLEQVAVNPEEINKMKKKRIFMKKCLTTFFWGDIIG